MHFNLYCTPPPSFTLHSSVSLVMEFQTNTLEKTLPTYYLFKRRKKFYEDLDEIENWPWKYNCGNLFLSSPSTYVFFNNFFDQFLTNFFEETFDEFLNFLTNFSVSWRILLTIFFDKFVDKYFWCIFGCISYPIIL